MKLNSKLLIDSINPIQRNILVGSILGDGSLALYGRSKNAHYREHGCDKQLDYRKWKYNRLKSLGFKLGEKGKLSSPSNPLYTELHDLFYKDKRKVLTKDNLRLLDHPIGLTCMYLDDGSLVMDFYTRPNKVQIFPRVSLYTQCFSYEENILLKNHILDLFNISFKIKKRPDGKKYSLEINERNMIYKFIQLIKPYVNDIPCMNYKVDVEKRLIETKLRLESSNKYMHKKVLTSPITVENNSYSDDEVDKIIKLKNQGYSYRQIADQLDRSYWGIYDKIRRHKKELDF